MVEDSSIQNLISWAKEGDMFYVHNCIKLSDAVLPKFFKHNNWQSFVRQLN
ncbi:HSF-type DNA-binding-domain-containing protein, partial [Mortierella sp. GBAus27b]